MVLHVDNDSSYTSVRKVCSRVAGYFHLLDNPNITPYPKLNGDILVECKTLRYVVSLAAKAETAGIFHNAQVSIPIRTLLQALEHPQPPTLINTDNSTTNGFIHDNIHQRRSKSWKMRWYWLRDRETQHQFLFYWDKGSKNEVDYFTKNHATSYHRQQRPRYARDKT